MDETRSHDYFLKRGTGKGLDIAKDIFTAAEHHINSFNNVYEDGLRNICKNLNAIEISNQEELLKDVPFSKMRIWYEDFSIGSPYKQGELGLSDPRIFPSECRIKGKSYCAPFLATLAREIDDEPIEKVTISLGEIPIMVKSKNCHLANLTPEELVAAKEDCNEFGGYFIINGIEKLVRMLISTKRNYPVGFIRASYVNKGTNFTKFAVQMRCIREDQYAKTFTLHYISDGDICLRILHRKQEVLIPVAIILKALIECSDETIYKRIVFRGEMRDSSISERAEVMIRSCLRLGLKTRSGCLKYLGTNFRSVLSGFPHDATDEEVGELFIRENICVQLQNFKDKFDCLCVAIAKLYALVTDKINPDNLDGLVNHEVLLPGQLFLLIIREYLEESLLFFKQKMVKDCSKVSELAKLREISYFRRAIEVKGNLGKRLEAFLATGNIKSQTGLDLMQAKGFCVVADKLNAMRFLAHFRSIHRGAYFTEMKTTAVRKLLPDNWGFVCPVHTPDGSPCGLLNHMSSTCKILTEGFQEINDSEISSICVELGMIPNTSLNIDLPNNCLPVSFDGKLLGFVPNDIVDTFVESLRICKINGTDLNGKKYSDLKFLEIAYFPINEHNDKNLMYPMIFLSGSDSRFTRPVKHLKSNKIEFISPLEQVNLSIACLEDDIRRDTRYQEISPANILSILARNIPFLEHNQSPRNMYQCQMAKQTLGTACHNLPYRFDNKTYRLYTPQLPIVKPSIFEDYGFADYPSGTNAIVAVISYTGYDMEDAMIVNKSSYERGLAHGCVYKTLEHQLGDGKKTKYTLINDSKTKDNRLSGFQADGMPRIGESMKKGTPELALHDLSRNSVRVYNYKDNERSRIDQIAFITNEENENDTKILYKIRIPRNPVIGDKFSSRHGQKGVLSVLWPQIDMPFSESGMTPDIIINPNAFPSRMTIGMLIESMAGKVGSLKGKIQETEPFAKYERGNVVDFYGEQLVKAGYNYYGSEFLYSGIYGTPLKADIYFGVVYYQRLRHMVSDKSQARSTGPVDVLTQQPVKGRKKHGGIRLGEMERDALLAHGSSYILHERLLLSSDYNESYVCSGCGSILSTFIEASATIDETLDLHSDGVMMKTKPHCKNCNRGHCVKVVMPFVLRYLANELAAMNIKMRFFVN